MDESARGDHFVLGGCVAPAEAWSALTTEWDQLLGRFGRFDGQERYFHMKEWNGDHDAVQAFYRCMERHVPVFLSCRFSIAELQRAMSRIRVVGAEVEWDFNTYFIAFRCLMDKFHLHRHEMVDTIPLTERVDFYFDDNSNKKHVRRAWDEYIENRPPEVRALYGLEPRFESDRVFKPLQAADLWAWWVSKWVEDGHPERIFEHDFGSFKRTPGRRRGTIDISFTEEHFIPTFRRIAQAQAPGRLVIVVPPAISS